jgi:8-oxo-dGTP pyrophosphatase MutT (NUDIX family)
MISFQTAQGRFNYRVAGICIDNGYVLLHRNAEDDFWAFPGGRGELMEPSKDTLIREMMEEVGVQVEVERLLWVSETFFHYNNEGFHELGFYYKITIEEKSAISNKEKVYEGIEGDKRLIFQWFPIAQVEQMPVYPSFLRKGVQELPKQVHHIVHTDTL